MQLNNSGGSYRLEMDAQNDAQAWVAGQYLAVSDDWETTPPTSGHLPQMRVDTLSGLDNDSRHVTKALIGAVAEISNVAANRAT